MRIALFKRKGLKIKCFGWVWGSPKKALFVEGAKVVNVELTDGRSGGGEQEEENDDEHEHENEEDEEEE